MNFFHTQIGFVHTIFGITALLFGALVVAYKKGTNKHKSFGYLYFLSMILLNITALFTQVLYKFGPFHWLALCSLVGVLIGMSMPVFFRKYGFWLKWHYDFMLWSYVGLVAAFFAEIIVRFPFFINFIPSLSFWKLVIITSLIVFIVGGYFIESKRKKHLN